MDRIRSNTLRKSIHELAEIEIITIISILAPRSTPSALHSPLPHDLCYKRAKEFKS